MTNFEKYKDDLIKIEGDFAFDKNTKEIVGCNTLDGVERRIDCVDCIFNNENCFESDKIKWLYEEYEEPILSNDELELINVLGKINGKEYKYIIRDTYGVVRLFIIKPRVNKSGYYYSEYGYTYIDSASGDNVLFSNIAHEDGIYDIENKCFIKEEGSIKNE